MISFLATAALLLLAVSASNGQISRRGEPENIMELGGSPDGSGAPLIVTLANRTNCGPNDPEPPNRVDTSLRVSQLIAELNANDYDAFIVPTSDQHQSEYPPDADRRREYISGFSGTAGYAVVLATDNQRALWTDGRYFLQADDELDCNWLLMKLRLYGVPSLSQFLVDNLASGNVVAADSRLIGYGSWNDLKNELKDAGIELVATDTNPIDGIWEADTENPRPAYGSDPAFVHDISYTGKSFQDKLTEVRASLANEGAQALVITTLDEAAWLFNIRGNDVVYNPVVRSYVILTTTSATWYLDQTKVTPEIVAHLGSDVQTSDYENVWTDLRLLRDDSTVQKVMISDDSIISGCSFKVYNSVGAAKRLLATTPTLKMKAQKNSVELERIREALVRDSVALSDFLAELERRVKSGHIMTEVSAQDLLTTYRASQVDYRDLSFAAISAYGDHGAIIHYISTNLTDVEISTDNLYLIDSGAQYLGASTDITRTVHFGTPTEEQIEMYTRVLMGVIDFASFVFPLGTKKSHMDILARRALYDKGLDYRTGTSHGIGQYLFIHESVEDAFKLGYVQSDEPGFYKDGEYGIRIENQIIVVDTHMKFDKPFYTFETLSLVPFEPKMIDMGLMTRSQKQWLEDFNAAVLDVVGSEMLSQGRTQGYDWLVEKTTPWPSAASVVTVTETTLLVAFVVMAVNGLLWN